MIEYLERLVEEEKYREALDVAERLIGQVEDPREIVRIHAARVVSHCLLGEEQAALASGEFAIGLAQNLEDWDSYGTMTLYVGVAYARLGQLPEVVSRMYEFLAKAHLYQTASEYEYNAWYNLGYAQIALNEPNAATVSLSNALKAAERSGEHRYAHGVRQSLVDAYLRAGLFKPIPRLLAECAAYLRQHPELSMHKMSWANHIRLRCEYALATGRLDRARVLATRALQAVQGEPDHRFLFHVVLAKTASRMDLPEEAIGHGLAARTCAVVCRRPDWEKESTDLLIEMIHRYPDAISSVDQYHTGTRS
ncbi:MAG TPA: hypothetical protein VD969_05575 [Symbiobacteriaceae bacterium]|nr:hypothetical protein [Symbiobacteriaceae bacterium]